MKVYTSYYKKFEMMSQYKVMNMVPVRISTSEPSWFPYETEKLPVLYPGWDLVKGIKEGTLTSEQYADIYKERLSRVSRECIWKRLEEFSKQNSNNDIVLLCYEKLPDFCHRHIVAEWLGEGITELC